MLTRWPTFHASYSSTLPCCSSHPSGCARQSESARLARRKDQKKRGQMNRQDTERPEEERQDEERQDEERQDEERQQKGQRGRETTCKMAA